MTQLVRMLADPRPYDLDAVDLAAYRRLVAPWRDWSAVREACAGLADSLLSALVLPESPT